MGLRLCILMMGCLVPAAFASEGAPAEKPERPPVERIGPDLYRIGAVTLDAKKRQVRCPGIVNMSEGGPIELLACTRRGKTHESVLVLSAEPKHLQTALLLLGLVEGRNPAVEPPEGAPEPTGEPGAMVRIDVEWRQEEPDGQADPLVRRARAERLLFNVKTEEPAEEAEWVFLGSRMFDDEFGADIEGSLISTYHDPLAILELAHPTVNDDTYYVVNAELCPPVETPVELVIQARPRAEEAAGQGSGAEDGEADKE